MEQGTEQQILKEYIGEMPVHKPRLLEKVKVTESIWGAGLLEHEQC